ncbi:hypothetical protein WJX74_003325 [Apatococcus lobatus]|uniref:BZIP domain-containing protein n=1 Tax=Apatococcus lobatus TaxID=904363 RepID=A0AAW1S5T9_9CHLO
MNSMHASGLQQQQQAQWGPPAVRQNTVDAMLDDLQIPDVRMDLNIPDDSFDFQGYPGLAAPSLNPAGSLRDPLRAGSLGAHGLRTGMSGDMDVFAQNLPEGFLASLGSQDPSFAQPPSSRLVTTGNDAAQPGFPTDPQLPGMPQLPPLTSDIYSSPGDLYSTPFAAANTQFNGMLNMPTGMPALSDGSGSGPRVLEPDEAFPSTAENDPQFDSHLDSHPHAYGLGPLHDTKTKRNAKQQMQNKQAQQRYRERRKQRFTEMESQVKVLTNQLQDQASLRRQNNALMARVKELEHAVLLRTSALEQVKQQLNAQGLAEPSIQPDREDSNDSEQVTASGGDFDTYIMRPGVSINRQEQLVIARGRQQAKEAQLRGFADVFTRRYTLLKQFIETHHLRDVSPTDVANTSQELQKELLHLLTSGSKACMAAEQSSGIKVLDLMTRNLQELTHMTCREERKKWITILQALKLTQAQSDTIVEMRKVLLHKLGSVYDERRQLHLQTMALMGSMASCSGNKMACMEQLPGQPPGSPVAAGGVKPEPGSAEDSLEQRIAGMSLSGYSYCARNDVSLDQMLDKIKDNLRLEQRIICELNATIIHKVFTPIQAALFLVEIYPAYTDTLALANIVEWLRAGRSSTELSSGKLEAIPSKEDKSDASDQCSLDRTDS